MKKFKLLALALGLMTLTFASCGEEEKEKQDVIVSILKNGSIDYWKQVTKGIEEECASKGLGTVFFYTNTDADLLNQRVLTSGIEKLESDYNIKGVIIAPIFTDNDHSVEQALADYVGSDIPVVVIDSPIDEDDSPLKNIYKAYVGTDNEAAGEELAKKITNKGDILVARIEASIPTKARIEGFEKGTDNEIEYWDANDSERPSAMEEQLKKYPAINDVVFLNGNLCKSVFNSSTLQKKNVYTFDAYEEFIISLQDGGCIKGIMAQNTFEMGRKAVSSLFDYIKNKNIYIPTIYITKDNLKSSDVKPFMDYFGL